MTFKEKRNYYNVKFLKGYGHSISVKDSKIILKDNHDPFSKSTSEEWFPNGMPYEKIIILFVIRSRIMTFLIQS